eukprot:12936563-Prorocentrum_lima.AAC.1
MQPRQHNHALRMVLPIQSACPIIRNTVMPRGARVVYGILGSPSPMHDGRNRLGRRVHQHH